jgi:molybdenum cofactor synthesis domain-containing protein
MVMKPMKTLLDLEEGLRIVMDAAQPIERTEHMGLLEAAGRVLAEEVCASMDVPPFARAAMDGYAVRAEDTFGAGNFSPKILELIEVIHAGECAHRSVLPGSCIQVATGAPMPDGADAVVMVEDTELDGTKVKVYKPVYPQQHASPMGEDIPQGRLVLQRGVRLDPSKIGVLAALGLQKVGVYQKPQVAVIPSGNEILMPGEVLSPGKIYDINSYTLSALISENGGLPHIFPIMKDTLESTISTIREALAYDLIVLSGGSSVGERDMMLEAVQRMGELKFHGIAVKPGKPTMCGIVEGHLLLGMPGYPTSCLTNGYGILAPALRKMARLSPRSLASLKAPMSRRYTSTIGRHQYLPVRLDAGEAVPAFKESGAITSMADAEGYIEIPANVDLLEKGEIVAVLLF